MSKKSKVNESEIVKLKLAGISGRIICKMLKCCNQTIKKVCEKRGLSTSKFKNGANIEQFINISDSAISYFLGYIWADGFIIKSGKKRNPAGIGIQLQEDDGKHLFSLVKDKMDIRGKTSTRIYKDGLKRKSQFIMHLSDTLFVKWLIELDYDKKSFFAPTKMLANVPETHHAAFWLGYFDGDGHLDTNKRQVIFSSSYEQDWQELKNLCKRLSIDEWYIKQTISKKGHKGSIFVINKKDAAIKFMEYLYTARHYALKRKLEKFDFIFMRNLTMNMKKIRREFTKNFVSKHPEMKQRELCKKLNISESHLAHIRAQIKRSSLQISQTNN